MATSDKTKSPSSQKDNTVKEVITPRMTISTTALGVIPCENISVDTMAMFEEAIFHVISKHQIVDNSIDGSNYSNETKSIVGNISSSRKIDLRKVLQLTEEIAHPIYLYSVDGQKNSDLKKSLFVDGLAPDIAWKFQVLLDNWHRSNPSLYPSVKLSLYNMRLNFDNKALDKLYEFFQGTIEFDRIISLKDLFRKDETDELFPEEVAITINKLHLSIYLKKDLDKMTTIYFTRPESKNRSASKFGLLISDNDVLVSICDLIKPKIMLTIDAILGKAKDMGFDGPQASNIRENFINTFSISPVITEDNYYHLQKNAEDLFRMEVDGSNVSSIKTDFDVLHYIRSLADSNISIEELLAGSTIFIHESELINDKQKELDISYNLAITSGKPIILTRYFLTNSHKFYIQRLDLSNVRLISQPDIEIVSRLKYLKTLILNNSRPCGTFNLKEIKFGNFPNLENLSIRDCSVKKLTLSMFQGTSRLKRVFATGNNITEIDIDCFANSPIEELHIDLNSNSSFSSDILTIIEGSKNKSRMNKRQLTASFQNN